MFCRDIYIYMLTTCTCICFAKNILFQQLKRERGNEHGKHVEQSKCGFLMRTGQLLFGIALFVASTEIYCNM